MSMPRYLGERRRALSVRSEAAEAWPLMELRHLLVQEGGQSLAEEVVVAGVGRTDDPVEA